jgi:hypothetical protein
MVIAYHTVPHLMFHDHGHGSLDNPFRLRLRDKEKRVFCSVVFWPSNYIKYMLQKCSIINEFNLIISYHEKDENSKSTTFSKHSQLMNVLKYMKSCVQKV